MAEEILAFLLFALVLIGMRVIRVLLKISETLEGIRGSLPDRVFRGDTEGDSASMRTYWHELRVSANRLARIYDKYVLGEDYKSKKVE